MNAHGNSFILLFFALLLPAAGAFCQKPIIGAVNWDAWNGMTGYYAERQSATPPSWAHLRPFFTHAYNDTGRLTRSTLDTAECVYQFPAEIVGFCLQAAFDRADAGKNTASDVRLLFSTDGSNFEAFSGLPLVVGHYPSTGEYYVDDVYDRSGPTADQSWLKVNYYLDGNYYWPLYGRNYRYLKILMTRTTGSPDAVQLMRLEVNTGDGRTVFEDELNDFTGMTAHSANLAIARDFAYRFECVSGTNHHQSVRDQEILYAERAGIDFWAFVDYNDPDFCLNWYHETMANSVYKDRINYCVILCNGAAGPRESWTQRVMRYVGYMKESNYQTVLGGRPLVFEFQWSGSNAELAELRDSAQSAGLPNPYLVKMDGQSYDVDACGGYGGGTDWASWGAKVVPSASFGYNIAPRADNPAPWGAFGGSDAPGVSEIINRLRTVVQWTNANPSIAEANVAMFYAWNENIEGGWAIPTRNPDGTPNTDRIDAMHDYFESIAPDTVPVTSFETYPADSVIEVMLSTQLLVVAGRSNGSSDTVTNHCQYLSLDPAVAGANGPKITGLSVGLARIRVLYQTFQGPVVDTAEIRIAPSTGTLTPDSVNLISNPGFTSGTTGWTFYTDGASASLSTDAGMAKVSVTDGGGGATQVQFYQSGLYLVPGEPYLVRFKAKSSGTRALTAAIHLHGSPWTGYWSQAVNLDTSVQIFGYYPFIYDGPSSTELRINFQCGSNDNSVWIDDVEVRHATLITGIPVDAAAFYDKRLTAFPNPFNPSTVIRYSLPFGKDGTLSILNLKGERVFTTALKSASGQVGWDGQGFPSGLYVARLAGRGGFEKTLKILLVK
ncbi:MAG: carbohydrate binding domain-containing protein [Fibrobacterota bacterium]